LSHYFGNLLYVPEKSFQKDNKGRYSIPGYNFSQVEQLQAIISTHIELESFAILFFLHAPLQPRRYYATSHKTPLDKPANSIHSRYISRSPTMSITAPASIKLSAASTQHSAALWLTLPPFVKKCYPLRYSQIYSTSSSPWFCQCNSVYSFAVTIGVSHRS
jgi:hypothetical protein